MNRVSRTIGFLLPALVVLGSAMAQTDQPGTKPAAAPVATARPAKLAEWPALKDVDKERVLAQAGQLRKADPALHEVAQKQLVAIGEGAMPLLFGQISDQPQNSNPQLFVVFDTVLQPQHAALMVRESKKPKVELRRYLLRRLCRFADQELLPVLVATAKDKDPETAFFGSLGALALKHQESLPAVLAYSKTNWKTIGPLVAEVLPAARSNEVGAWVFEAIAKAPAADQGAGLRLLRYLAVKDQTVVLRTYLASPENAVKKEAVNTMRVLHGEPPIENLSVFQAIEMAKVWLGKA